MELELLTLLLKTCTSVEYKSGSISEKVKKTLTSLKTVEENWRVISVRPESSISNSFDFTTSTIKAKIKSSLIPK